LAEPASLPALCPITPAALHALRGFMTTYRIKDWNKVFEDYRSREVAELEFVKWPVRRSSEAFYMLARTAEGMIAFGVFAILVQWAARCPLRGTLRDERGPVTPERFADRYGMPIKVARKAFAALADRDFGWLEITDGAPTEHRPSTDDGSMDRTVEPPTKHHQITDGAPTPHRAYATITNTKTTTAAAATKTLPTPLSAEPAAAAAGDPLREWAERQARRPDWLPEGKPWISAGTWLTTAQASPNITTEQFEEIIREARQSRSTLANPAGFVLAQIRKIGGVA